MGPTLIGKRIVLGVTGSIAAYKAVALLRSLIREGAVVQVVMTHSATKFVTPLTFEVLSGHPVSTDLFEAHQEMKHLSLPAQADAIIIAPATANCLAKAALGLGDDLLSTMLLTSQCPLIMAPAMDGGMWTHPSVQEHVNTLCARGTAVVTPELGRIEVVAVATAEEMLQVLSMRLAWSTTVIMAAAVADFRPIHPASQKIKKQDQRAETLNLERTTDILASLSAQRTTQLLVGFAAETSDLIAHAQAKLTAKGLDLIVANDVTREGSGFGSDQNAATLIDRQGIMTELPLMPKRALADAILSRAYELIRARQSNQTPTTVMGGR
ncbi:MAG: bifunctional 4'-phosphopantothenoylcysteine decarboxylase/phosphopantothenoylcysteine synthetase [Nitrospira sp.]|nr:MAG: bifunctional 4'-phosphopantothenoylcysteine decarboxylase/phosphopantothenoylcysteine synthetase [Nitrospira sp.]